MPALKWTLRYNGQTVVLQGVNGYIGPLLWDETELQLERSEKWRGMFYIVGKEYGFYCKGGGKELIDQAHHEAGSEGEVELDIEALCSNVYTPIMEGKVVMRSWREEQRGSILYSFVEIEQRGITSILGTREDVEVNLLATESLGGVALTPYTYSAYDLNLHSKVVRLASEWDNGAANDLECCRTFPASTVANLHFAEWELAAGELDKSNDVAQTCTSSSLSTEDVQPIIEIDQNLIFPLTITVDYEFAGDFTDSVFDTAVPCGSGAPTGTSRSIQLQNINTISTTDIVLVLLIGQTFASATSVGGSGTADQLAFISGYSTINTVWTVSGWSSSGTLTQTVNRGDKIWLVWLAGYSITIPGGQSRDVNFKFDYSVCRFKISSDTTTNPSTCKAIAIHEAWSRLCEGITDQTLAFKSEFFGRTNSQGLAYPSNGCGSFSALSNGLNIRQFNSTFNDSSIFHYTTFIPTHPVITSLKDMFESLDAIYGLSLQVESHNDIEVVRVEEADYAYQNIPIMRCPNVPKIQTSFAKDMAFNEAEIGYTKWETEEINGMDEPNAKANWVFTGIKDLLPCSPL